MCAIAEPTIETAQRIMNHPGVKLLVVTGGAAVVQAAMASGKRAICAGPGNPPVVVDETADLRQAGRDIVRGASFDNNIICTDEKEVFAVASIADELIRQMCAHGALRIDSGQLERLRDAIFADRPRPGERGRMNAAFIGKNAKRLLAEIGVAAGDELRLVVVEVERDDPLVLTEQMMPILPVVRVRDADEGDRSRQGGRARLPPHRRHALQEPRPPQPDGARDGLQHLRQERPVLRRARARRRGLQLVHHRQPDRRGADQPGELQPHPPVRAQGLLPDRVRESDGA